MQFLCKRTKNFFYNKNELLKESNKFLNMKMGDFFLKVMAFFSHLEIN